MRLYLLLLLLMSGLVTQAQKRTVQTDNLVVKDTLFFKGKVVRDVSRDSSFDSPSHEDVPTEKAVYDFVQSLIAGGGTQYLAGYAIIFDVVGSDIVVKVDTSKVSTTTALRDTANRVRSEFPPGDNWGGQTAVTDGIYLLGIGTNANKIRPDTTKLLTHYQHKLILADSLDRYQDSIAQLRAAISAIQGAGGGGLGVYRIIRPNFILDVLASDTAGFSYSRSSGTCTISLPAGVRSVLRGEILGTISDLSGGNFQVIVQTPSSLVNQGVSTLVNYNLQAWKVPTSGELTSSNYSVLSVNPPQTRGTDTANGDLAYIFYSLSSLGQKWSIHIGG